MKILSKQIWHLLFLIILLLGINFFIKYDDQIVYGNLWRIKSQSWLYLTIFFAIFDASFSSPRILIINFKSSSLKLLITSLADI